MRLIFFGDSLTRGKYGVNYIEKLATAFPQHSLHNAGINGDTSLNLYRRVQQDVIDHKPDGVFIMIGINDALSVAEPGTRLYYRWIKQVMGGQVTPEAFRRYLGGVIDKLILTQCKLWLALPPIETRPAAVVVLRTMNEIAREVCAQQQVPVLDLMHHLTPEVVPNRLPFRLMDYRRNLHVMLQGVSLYDRYKHQGDYTYSFDGVHLTAHGAHQFANLIVPFLRSNGVA